MDFLELALREALTVTVIPDRVPPGYREGGQFAARPTRLTRHDTPQQAAGVINAMEPRQRAAVRASILVPPGYDWAAGDRLTEAR